MTDNTAKYFECIDKGDANFKYYYKNSKNNNIEIALCGKSLKRIEKREPEYALDFNVYKVREIDKTEFETLLTLAKMLIK